MSTSLNDIASQIIATLRVTDPDLDTSIGTTARKIIDAVSESISEAYIDQHLLTYQYDIDAKVDADLDDFVQLFGMARLAAKRSSGVAVFTRSASLDTIVSIPVGTQIQSNTDPAIVVQTVTGAFLEIGATSVSVPVQAVEAGPSGNLAANSLALILTPVEGVTSVTNIQPLTGGTAQEKDVELRERWKRTVFRSLAGTEQMYLGVALDDENCYAANVVGASKKRREQVQIVGGQGQTTVDDAVLTYTSPVFVGLNIDSGDLFVQGVDYSWNTTVNPPRIDVIDAVRIPNGTIVQVDFEYQPEASRNDVERGITNRVDVWCGGQSPASASQTLIFRSTNRFTATTTDRLYRGNFRRPNGSQPDNNNVFVPLAFGPVITVPPTLTIGGALYGQASVDHPLGTTGMVGSTPIAYAYNIVHEDGATGYTPTSLFGLEWDSSHMPPSDSVFSFGEDGDYTYNKMIADIQAAVDRWRLLGVDAKVHQAKQVALRLSLAVMYDLGANQTLVNSQINEGIAKLLTGTGFVGRVQVSDLLQVVHNVSGVDNVRFLHGGDYTGYNSATPNAYQVGIQQMVDGAVAQSFVDSTGRPHDIDLGDSELPVFHSTYLVVKAQNSFGIA